MAYKPNYKNTQVLMDPNEYEFVIADAYEHRPMTGGSPCIVLLLAVRNDVEQPYQNKAIRTRMFLSENAMPYTETKMNTISKVVGLDEHTEYASYNEWGDAIRGKPLRGKVKHREYNGQTYEDISYFKRSEVPECKHVWKDDSGDGARRVDREGNPTASTPKQPAPPPVNEDELPF